MRIESVETPRGVSVEKISCKERFRFAKNELATKFVVGLGRVREIYVVYWREIGRNEKNVKGGKVWEGEKIMDMRE